MRDYSLGPIDEVQARAVCGWRYGPGYGLYDMDERDLACLLDPDFAYYAVCRADGMLAGFACFGEDAQIYGGPYQQPALDIGCGMAPDLCGQGRGGAFLDAIIAFASRHFRPPLLRLSVAESNQRAQIVYQRAGFVTRRRFAGMTRSGVFPFLVMTRRPDAGGGWR